MLSKAEIKYFNECASEILSSEKVQLMRTFPHHGNVSCLEHSLSVAYYSYLLCKKLHLSVDIQSVIRGALLHDFFFMIGITKVIEKDYMDLLTLEKH
ncbi:MAG: HD domain-containing protein [Clostridioides difficile]